MLVMSQIPTPTSVRPRVTVAAIVEDQGRFLVVEERDEQGALVINQPAGHVEGGESIVEALVREAIEETAWEVRPFALVGIYLWSKPDQSASFLRVAVACEPLKEAAERSLDQGIERALWLSRDELILRSSDHRSPLVFRCIEDYLKGQRFPLDLIQTL